MASIQYGDVTDTVPLPVDAQDIVTRVHLVVAGNRAGAEPRIFFTAQDDGTGNWTEAIDKAPLPILYTYTADEHTTYGCSRAFDLPSGIDPFLQPEDESIPEPTVTGWSNPGDPSAVRDGDPTTFASITGAGSIFYGSVTEAWGFRVRYEATRSGGNALEVICRNQRGASASQGFITYSHFDLNSSEPTDLYFVLPADARNEAVNTPGLAGNSYRMTVTAIAASGTDAKIYHFYPLLLDEALLLDIAKRNVKLPASEPKRVTVRGYVAPDREHTIVGWPGGDFTGTVAQHQYELGRTVIDFEQAGAPTGLSAVSMQEARRQQVAVDRALQKALYPVRMGERQ